MTHERMTRGTLSSFLMLKVQAVTLEYTRALELLCRRSIPSAKQRVKRRLLLRLFRVER